MIQFIVANQVVFLGLALAVSETLALIPQVKSNGIFDFFFKLIKSMSDKSMPASKVEGPKV